MAQIRVWFWPNTISECLVGKRHSSSPKTGIMRTWTPHQTLGGGEPGGGAGSGSGVSGAITHPNGEENDHNQGESPGSNLHAKNFIADTNPKSRNKFCKPLSGASGPELN